jgi:hypothetical protein
VLLAMVAMYLCGLALFTAHGPAVASALIAFQPDGVVQSRIAMLDISALAFGLLAIAAFALAICIVIVAAIRLMQCWRFADDAEARQRPALADMGFRRNRLRKVCGDAADLGCVGGNVDGSFNRLMIFRTWI